MVTTVITLNIFRKNKDLVDAKYLQMYQDPELAAEELYNSHSIWWNLQMVIFNTLFLDLLFPSSIRSYRRRRVNILLCYCCCS
jgi:hypothetical protein